MHDDQKKYFVIFFVAALAFVGYWLLEGWVFSGNHIAAPAQGEISVVPATSTPYSLGNSYNTGSSTTLLAASPQPANLTQQIAQNLQSQFVSQLQQQGATDTPSLISKIQAGNFQNFSNISNQLTPDTIGVQTSIDDALLHIVDGASAADITAYKAQYEQYLSGLATLSGSQITGALSGVFNGQDTGQLDMIIQSYQHVRDGLVSMHVPRTFLTFHKENVLFFENMVTVLTVLRNEQTDPLKAYVAVQYLPQLSSQWDVILQDVKTLIQ